MDSRDFSLSEIEEVRFLGIEGISIEKVIDKVLEIVDRIKEPKAPTHEEIITKWWNVYGKVWCKIICYDGGYWMFDREDNQFAVWSKETFQGKRSSDTPPETI